MLGTQTGAVTVGVKKWWDLGFILKAKLTFIRRLGLDGIRWRKGSQAWLQKPGLNQQSCHNLRWSQSVHGRNMVRGRSFLDMLTVRSLLAIWMEMLNNNSLKFWTTGLQDFWNSGLQKSELLEEKFALGIYICKELALQKIKQQD